MKVHVGSETPSTKTPWGKEYLISLVLCRSLQLCICLQLCGWDWSWHCSRGASPTNALGVAVISAEPKCESASWSKSLQDLGWWLLLWQRSLLCFQLRALSFLQIQTSHLPPLLKTFLTYFAMRIQPFALYMHATLPKKMRKTTDIDYNLCLCNTDWMGQSLSCVEIRILHGQLVNSLPTLPR